MIDLPHVFGPPTHLHLVIWNRLEPADHHPAMEALKFLMQSAYATSMMPLLRPLGRPPDTYCRYAYDRVFDDVDIRNLKLTPLLDGIRTAHCELWVQVADSANSPTVDELKKLFSPVNSTCFFWDNQNPIWQPLGHDKFTCEYVRSRMNRQDPLVCSLCDDRVAWILKLIWFRATEVIQQWHQSTGILQPLNPDSQLRPLRNLMQSTFHDLDLSQYGVLSQPTILDPTDFEGSHLAAFSFNSVTIVQAKDVHQIEQYQIEQYQIEQYLKDRTATWPSRFQDRNSFLNIFPA